MTKRKYRACIVCGGSFTYCEHVSRGEHAPWPVTMQGTKDEIIQCRAKWALAQFGPDRDRSPSATKHAWEVLDKEIKVYEDEDQYEN
jgi:hypothetical protein